MRPSNDQQRGHGKWVLDEMHVDQTRITGKEFHFQNRETVTLITDHNTTAASFGKLYISLREKEGRVYSDDEVAVLPEINARHLHYGEWQMRKRSSRQLAQHLLGKGREPAILEVGCGNGWLCHQLSAITAGKITGIDINDIELQQAKRVFGHIRNLEFIYGDIREGIVKSNQYDVIVFASSV